MNLELLGDAEMADAPPTRKCRDFLIRGLIDLCAETACALVGPFGGYFGDFFVHHLALESKAPTPDSNDPTPDSNDPTPESKKRKRRSEEDISLTGGDKKVRLAQAAIGTSATVVCRLVVLPCLSCCWLGSLIVLQVRKAFLDECDTTILLGMLI